MRTTTVLATASAVLATVAHATDIAVQPRMLEESFAPGNKTYVVGLRSSLSQSTFCAGLLITKKHVLSTTSCTSWAESAYVGENSGDGLTTGESLRIVNKTKHPKAKGNSYNYVIYELERESKFAPVALANRPASAYVGKKASVFGWNTSSYKPPSKNVLLRQTSTIHSQATCKKAVIYETLDSTLFCSGGGSSAPQCRGLTGAPVVLEREGGSDLALGSTVRTEGCANDGKAGAAGVYADAFAVKAWIQQTAPGVKFE